MTAVPSPAGEQPAEGGQHAAELAEAWQYERTVETALASAGALNAAVHVVDDDEAAQTLASLAMQWENEAARLLVLRHWPESGGTATPGGETCECVHLPQLPDWWKTHPGLFHEAHCPMHRPATATPPAVLDALAAGIEEHVTRDAARDGYCTCYPGEPMRDCGMAGHRFVAERLRERDGDRRDAAREAVARWLPRRVGDNDEDRLSAMATELLSLLEVQALIGGQPTGVLAEVAAEVARQDGDREWEIAPLLDTELPMLAEQRRALVETAAHYLRTVQAIDRRTGDGS